MNTTKFPLLPCLTSTPVGFEQDPYEQAWRTVVGAWKIQKGDRLLGTLLQIQVDGITVWNFDDEIVGLFEHFSAEGMTQFWTGRVAAEDEALRMADLECQEAHKEVQAHDMRNSLNEDHTTRFHNAVVHLKTLLGQSV